MQSKRISWKYEIEGLQKSQTQRDKLIVDSMNEYEEQAKATMTTVISVILLIMMCIQNQNNERYFYVAMIGWNYMIIKFYNLGTKFSPQSMDIFVVVEVC